MKIPHIHNEYNIAGKRKENASLYERMKELHLLIRKDSIKMFSLLRKNVIILKYKQEAD